MDLGNYFFFISFSSFSLDISAFIWSTSLLVFSMDCISLGGWSFASLYEHWTWNMQVLPNFQDFGCLPEHILYLPLWISNTLSGWWNLHPLSFEYQPTVARVIVTTLHFIFLGHFEIFWNSNYDILGAQFCNLRLWRSALWYCGTVVPSLLSPCTGQVCI